MNIHVAAALINQNGRLLAAQRSAGAQAGAWELPGGKVEEGESSVEALRREIGEELSCGVRSAWLYDTVEFDYPEFHLTMDCYITRLDPEASPSCDPQVHSELRWLARDELFDVEWLPADVDLLRGLAYYWDEAFSDQLL